MLFLHATNVHQGGGKALLDAVLQTLTVKDEKVLLLDNRMSVSDDILNKCNVKYILPFLSDRFMAEWWLAKKVGIKDVVLCFGNLPPLFRLSGRVIVFVQNKYLLEDMPLNEFPIKIRLRLHVERLWFRWRSVNVNEFVVQTPSMKTALTQLLNKHRLLTSPCVNYDIDSVNIKILPFVNRTHGYHRKHIANNFDRLIKFDFLYVASGEPHKNHRRLIEAWCILAEDGLFPSLCLTLDETRFSELCQSIEMMRNRYGVNIVNVGVIPHDQLQELYVRVGALVYPSTFESFGLPLIEARQAGLPVLASELDYVRDVLDPEQSFDPKSANSIARSVKRFMCVDELPLPLDDAEGFMNHILKEVE